MTLKFLRASSSERFSMFLAMSASEDQRGKVKCNPDDLTLYSSFMRKIVIDPNICNGQPIIEGTRITASTVLEFLSAGDSIDDVLAGYPTLTREDVLACLAYSAKLLKHHFDIGAVA